MGSKGSSGFFSRPALIMIIAGILMIIGSIGSWHHYWSPYWTGYVVSSTGVKSIVGFMGLVLLYSSVVNLGYVRFLEDMFPPLSISAICGVLALIGSIGAWSGYAGGGWGLYVTVLAAFVSLFAAFRAYQSASSPNRGKTPEEEESARKSESAEGDEGVSDQVKLEVYDYIVEHEGEIELGECATELGIERETIEEAVEALKDEDKLEKLS